MAPRASRRCAMAASGDPSSSECECSSSWLVGGSMSHNNSKTNSTDATVSRRRHRNDVDVGRPLFPSSSSWSPCAAPPRPGRIDARASCLLPPWRPRRPLSILPVWQLAPAAQLGTPSAKARNRWSPQSPESALKQESLSNIAWQSILSVTFN